MYQYQYCLLIFFIDISRNAVRVVAVKMFYQSQCCSKCLRLRNPKQETATKQNDRKFKITKRNLKTELLSQAENKRETLHEEIQTDKDTCIA